MKIGTIKTDTPEAQPYLIPESGKAPKSGTRVVKNSKHNYDIISNNKRVNHVTNFKNSPKVFPVEATEK